MTDGQLLFIVICLLYLTDCFVWLGKHSIAFIPMWGKRWAIGLASTYLGNSSGGFGFLNPLPPFKPVYLCHLPPLSISPKGVCSYISHSLGALDRPKQKGLVAEFKDISKVASSGNEIYINDSLFVRCKTSEQSKVIADILRQLSQTPENMRETLIIHFLKQGFNADNAKHAISQTNKKISVLRRLCNLFFVLLFIGSPVLVLQYGLIRTIIPIAAGMFVFAIAISLVFYAVHKSIFPQAKEERISNLTKMILCPPLAIRATDIITLQTLANYSPITVAHLLVEPGKFESFAKRFILDLKYPTTLECSDQRAAAIVTSHNAALLDICIDYLRNAAKIEMSPLSPPKPADTLSKTYCPRCLCEFYVDDGGCPYCPGVELTAFDKTTSSVSQKEGMGNG